MTVKNFSLLIQKEEEGGFELKDHYVEGYDYSVVGNIRNLDRSGLGQMRVFCQCLTMCNESQLVYKDISKDRRISIVGLPLEGALRVLVEKMGHYIVRDQKNLYEKTNELDEFTRVFRKDLEVVQTFEFTSERKVMTVVCEDSLSSNKIAFVKGGPELVLERSVGFLDNNEQCQPLDNEKREMILERIKQYSSQGLRCIGLGYKNSIRAGDQADEIERDLNFLGLVAMEDPPRPEVKSAIEKCRSAGIRLIVIMIKLKR
jgi:magnesium-transporting ATPase (P-type)